MYKRICYPFKYFQDVKQDDANKDNEEDSAADIHKVKTYDLHSRNKSTNTEDIHLLGEKEEEKPVTEPTEYETYSFSGTFRDGVSRIDLVLVLAETDQPDVQKLQKDYLLSIAKVGLKVEPEAGLMPAHRNLTFVKVHAPDAVLETYGEKLGVKKYFKQVHLEYIPKQVLCYKNKEKEWLSLVRNNYVQPLGYSNSERSLLVYKLLLNLRFGEHQNHFGLKRLLNWNIVSDVFALHDGPYFLTRKQNFSEVTARQILYYNWIGCTNIFKLQSLHLIEEYLGSRIGFYFAFKQFFTLGLVVASLAGIMSTGFGVVDPTYESARNNSCNDKANITMCPRCDNFVTCPFLSLKEYYCFGAKLVNVLDHLMLPVHCLFLVIWGFGLLTLWNRKERYLLWMWELHHVTNMTNTRPEFSINYNKPVRSDNTGLWKYYNSGISNLIRTAVTAVFYFACLYYVIWIFFTLVTEKYRTLMMRVKLETLPKDFEKYIIIALFACVVTVIFTIYEKICHVVAVLVNRFQNHPSVESYDGAMATKLFAVTSFCVYPILFYFAWFKSRLYYMPIWYDRFRHKGYEKITLISEGHFKNCGPHPCIDEVFVALTVSFLIKQALPKILYILIRAIWPIRTDYNQGKSINRKYPCWEREYRLKPITEDEMTRQYNYLALQFGYIILFGAASPLLPVAALILNLIDMRFTAREFLLTCRRPILLEKSGLDIWSTLFAVLAWTSILSNALFLAFNSRTPARQVYLKTHDNMTDFFMATISSFETKHYPYSRMFRKQYENYTGFMPELCYFPGVMLSKADYDKIAVAAYVYIMPDTIPTEENFQNDIYKYSTLMVFQYVGLTAALLMQYLIPPKPEDIEDSIKAEQTIKDAYLTHSEQ
ncbi:anoctamin-4 isoform X2 [Manduca sexta]|uniref:anoctamin-4 isoform X2 n=1 Tax=Manduca sexta TaxID=7130 RepID=UPI00188F8E22|nr:anoctamin-4 isoform X2 [Manduca sexta]